MKNIKKNLLKYFIEMLIVAFGVFLGIFVSEWKSNTRIKQNNIKSLKYIETELDNNIKTLTKTVKYHETIKTNLPELTKTLKEEELISPYFRGQKFRFTKIKGWSGIGLPKFETISFEGAKINGVFTEIDIELAQLIASAYKQISFNQDFGKSLFDKMINMDYSTKLIDAIGMVELLTSDVLNSEKALKKRLESILEQIIEFETKQDIN